MPEAGADTLPPYITIANTLGVYAGNLRTHIRKTGRKLSLLLGDVMGEWTLETVRLSLSRSLPQCHATTATASHKGSSCRCYL
jgi:hypothetical protein